MIAQLVKGLREQKGWTTAELAEKTGIDIAWHQELEAQGIEVDSRNITKLSGVFEIPVSFFTMMALDKDSVAPEKRQAFADLETPLKTLLVETAKLISENGMDN